MNVIYSQFLKLHHPTLFSQMALNSNVNSVGKKWWRKHATFSSLFKCPSARATGRSGILPMGNHVPRLLAKSTPIVRYFPPRALFALPISNLFPLPPLQNTQRRELISREQELSTSTAVRRRKPKSPAMSLLEISKLTYFKSVIAGVFPISRWTVK